MIHHTSTDFVSIKKIPLRVWPLKEELFYRFQESLGEQTSQEVMEQLKAEYDAQGPGPQSGNVLSWPGGRPQRPVATPQEHQAKATCILSEVSMEGISFFCHRRFISGQSVLISFLIPGGLILSAEMVSCRPKGLQGKVITQSGEVFRCLAKFQFARRGERTLLRQFLLKIEGDGLEESEGA